MNAHRARLAGSAALVALVVATLAYRVHRRLPFEVGDEGMRWLLSTAWAEGGSLFARFEPIYPTGQYAWFGLLLRALGESLDSLRLAHAALGGAAAAALFVTLRAYGPAGVAWVAALSFALPLSGTVKLLASMLVLAAALAVAVVPRLDPRRAFAFGALTGALVNWREDSAVLAGLVVGIALVRERSARLAAVAAAGAASGLAAWLLLAAARGDAGALALHLARRLAFLVIRLKRPMRVEWVAPPEPLANAQAALQTLLPLFWVLPAAVYLALLVAQWRRTRRGEDADRPTVTAAVVGCAYLPQFLWERNDLAHALDHRPILVAVVAVALARAGATARRWGVLGLALLFAASLATDRPWRSSAPAGVAYPTAAAASFGARVAELPPWAGLPHRPDETTIVIGWGAGHYALEGASPGTRFLSTAGRHLRWPGALDQLLADLGAPTNRWVLATPGTEPIAPIFLRLRADYALVATWHGYQLWERRSGPERTPGAEPRKDVDPARSAGARRLDAQRRPAVVSAAGWPKW